MDNTNLIVHAYDWKVKDESDDNGHVVIHCWALDRESKPHLLRFHDFPAYCYVELPLFIGHRRVNWSGYKAQQVYETICWKLGEDKPFKYFFKQTEKLYYYRGRKKYPMLVLLFNSVKAMYKCRSKLSKPFKVKDLGTVACKVWETNIPIVRKLLTLRKIKYCQWFNIKGLKVHGDDKISKLEDEYVVDRFTMMPISPEETSSWVTCPTILSFDIETYSDRHKALPDPYSSKHVAYMISCVFQRSGDPSSRITDIILLGDCNDTDMANVIKVNTEIELIDTMSELVNRYDPDILTGYNILGYDNPYLDTRLKRRLREWKPMGRLINEPTKMTSFSWGSSGYGHNEINMLEMDGRIMVDLLPIIRRDYKLPLYNLGYVSNYFLGRTKHDVTAKQMFEAYELGKDSETDPDQALKDYIEGRLELITSDPDLTSKEDLFEKFHVLQYMPFDETETQKADMDKIPDINLKQHAMEEMKKVVDYCVVDSDLVLDIFEKIHCWIALIEMSNVVGVTPVELFTRGQQLRVLSQVYDEASNDGIVIDERTVPKMEYSGGFVYEPIPGIYHYIPCLDFKSLYPTVMISHNIDYRTYVPPEMMDKIPDHMCHLIEWDEEIEKKIESDSIDGDKKTVTEKVHYKFKFIKQEHLLGILPRLLVRLISERDTVRKTQKTCTKGSVEWIVLERRQLALKVSANSVTGNTPIPCLVDGCFEYLTIEELADESTWRSDNVGNQVSQPKRNIKVWSDAGWTDIKFVIRHPVRKPLVRVNTHTGCVDCTTEHSLLRSNGQEVKPTDLAIGDKLMHIDTPLPIDTPTQPLYRSVSDKTIADHRLNDQIEKMAFVWGLFFAEGTCGNYGAGSTAKSSWCIYNQDEILLEKAASILNELEEPDFIIEDYGPYETTRPNNKKGEYYIKYLKPRANGKYGSVKRLVTKYRNLFYDQRKNKRIPSEILRAPIGIRQAFFLGYYAGDGNRHLKTGVVIVNKGQIGSAGLYYLMRSLGYQVSISFSSDSDKYDHFRLQCCTNFRNDNPDGVKRMTDAPIPPKIEPTEKKEIRNGINLEKTNDGIYLYKNIEIHCQRLPRQKLLDSLDSVQEKITNRGNIIRYDTDDKKVTYQCATCLNSFSSALRSLHTNKEPRHDKVCKCPVEKRYKDREIEPYEEKEYVEYIYDIETVSHHFAAGVGNMIVHNSMYGALGAQKGGKLPLPEAAACVTAKSRESIKKVNSYLESKGHKIVYGDSVTGDTPILCRATYDNGESRIFYRPISQLHDRVSMWVTYDESGKEYLLRPKNLEVWSDKGFTPIKHIMRHKTRKRIYRITTHTGVIKVTEDHSLLDINANEISPNTVSVGDDLLTQQLPMFPDDGINIDHAWVWGLFYGDGSCGAYDCPSGFKRSWAINNQNLDYLNKAKDYLEKAYPDHKFKILPTMESSGVYKLVPIGDVKSLVKEWRELLYDPITKYKKIPDIMWKCSRETRQAFFNGYYAADGDKGLNGDIQNTRFCNKGQIGSAGLFLLARSLGYKVSCNTRSDKPDIYRLTLTKNYQRKRPGVIKRIEDLGYIDDYVYDLETENHHFAAGVGELVVHNTDSSMPDIGITDPTKAYDMAKVVADELSKLFPPPMLVEDEEVYHTMLCIKKKMYLCIKMGKDGKPVLDRDQLKVKGVVPARRDNCSYQRNCYIDTAWNVLLRKPMMETYDDIINMCLKLMRREVPWKDLVVIKGLGAHYKNKSYCMKVFSDELCKIGKPATPGDRLEYLIVKPYGVSEKKLLGYKMRLPSTYLERLESDKPEPIDYEYYMEKALMNCIQKQLFQVGYKKELEELNAKYLDIDQNRVLDSLRKQGYTIVINQLLTKFDGNKMDAINYLLNSDLKKVVNPLVTYHIKKRGRINTRVTGEPIKMMVKLIQQKQKFTDVIKTLVPIKEVPNIRPAKLKIVTPDLGMTKQQLADQWIRSKTKYSKSSVTLLVHRKD